MWADVVKKEKEGCVLAETAEYIEEDTVISLNHKVRNNIVRIDKRNLVSYDMWERDNFDHLLDLYYQFLDSFNIELDDTCDFFVKFCKKIYEKSSKDKFYNNKINSEDYYEDYKFGKFESCRN